MDAQHIANAIDQLLSLNGWVAALCPTTQTQNIAGIAQHDAQVDEVSTFDPGLHVQRLNVFPQLPYHDRRWV
ncbi:hypothetical protein BD779DRAFT_1517190, partial [Infundibulicybe gibba]